MRRRSLRRLNAHTFAREDDAASLAEYALLLGVVAVALLVVLSQFSGAVSNLFARTTNSFSQVSADAGASGGAGGGGQGTGTGTGTGTGGNGGSRGNNGNANSGNNGSNSKP
ncbi:hypothetical protein [Gemmatimonas sp.]|uniref:hypothetical protein n=1 Tax=Gemmatimonas sp. TaxID=1962908 RepID=UPI003982E86D